MKLLMSNQKVKKGNLIHLVHRVNLSQGTRCGCELSNPVYFDGDESLITCSRCANPVKRKRKQSRKKPSL